MCRPTVIRLIWVVLYTIEPLSEKVIGCALSAAVYLEALPDHISTVVQDLESLLISGQLISSSSSLGPLLIIPSSEAILIQNHC
jgi:hypothetical protein